MTYSELLQQLTVESQDNGEVFTRTNRLERIKSLLHESSYELLYAGKLALIYGKKGVTPAKARLLVSSHIDTVYTHCFYRYALERDIRQQCDQYSLNPVDAGE